MTARPHPEATTGEADAWRAGVAAERAALRERALLSAPTATLMWVLAYLGESVPAVVESREPTGLDYRGG